MKSRRKTLAKYKAAGRAVQCILIMHITAISNWHPGRQTWAQQNHHERQWKSRKAGKAGWRKCASGRERAWRASERVSEREGATQMPVEANDMQINENKGINEWPKPVEVGTAFAICHFAIAIVRSPQSAVRSPYPVAFPGIANEPHNFCRLHFAAKAPEKAAPALIISHHSLHQDPLMVPALMKYNATKWMAY